MIFKIDLKLHTCDIGIRREDQVGALVTPAFGIFFLIEHNMINYYIKIESGYTKTNCHYKIKKNPVKSQVSAVMY